MEQARMLETTVPAEDEIDVMEAARTLWRFRLLIATVTVLGSVGALAVNLLTPNTYTATATIMPADSSGDRLSAALSSLGALGSLASAGGGLKGSVSDKLVAVLDSRTLTENVIKRYQLLPVLFQERWDATNGRWSSPSNPLPFLGAKTASESIGPSRLEAANRLQERVKAKADSKTGMIHISVDMPNPQAAAEIANYFVLELNAFLQGNSLTSTKRNRDFLEGQVDQVSTELGKLENDLKVFQEKHRLVSLDAQSQASVQAYASLQSQLTTKEMELALQATSVSEHDMNVIALKQEIAQIEAKLDKIENGSSQGVISFKDAPQLSLRFAQLKRDIVVKQKVFELLTQQLELAKVEENKETLSFQVIDQALAPEKKSKPKRLLNVLIATIAALFVGIVLAFCVTPVVNLVHRLKPSAVTPGP